VEQLGAADLTGEDRKMDIILILKMILLAGNAVVSWRVVYEILVKR
jgi:hypothetical protein